MNELFFVLKCLGITAVVVTFSQVSISGMTIEERVDESFRTSRAAVWVQGAAAGGALAVTHAVQSVRDSINGGSRHDHTMTHAQRAGRY